MLSVTSDAIALLLILLAVGIAFFFGRKLEQKRQLILLNNTVERLNRHGSAVEIYGFCLGHGLVRSTLIQDLRCIRVGEMAKLLVSLVHASFVSLENPEEFAVDFAKQLLHDKPHDPQRYEIIKRMIARNNRHPEDAKILLQQLQSCEERSITPS